MFNPNMFNQMAGQMPQLPSTADLWKDEKGKYRHWMIIFFVGICAVLALIIVGMVMMISDKENIINKMVAEATGVNGFDKITDANGVTFWNVYGKNMTLLQVQDFYRSGFTSSFIIQPSMNIGFIGIGVLLFVASLYESYKAKSFAKLSSWPTFVIGFGAFMGFFALISFSWNHTNAFVSDGAILIFVANIATLVVYFGGGMQVSRIRKQFVMSDRIEKMKANPQFQQAAQNMMGGMMGGMQNNGAYAPQNMNPTGTPAPQQPVNPTVTAAGAVAADAATTTPQATPAQPTEKQKLEAMSHDNLIKLGKKLSISGAKDMSKEELIQAILRIHETK